MGRPLAYAHIGHVFNGKIYTIVEDDDPNSGLHYVVPEGYRIAKTTAGKPKIAIAVCEDLDVPSIDGTGTLEPYISPDAEADIKKHFGSRLAPLPMTTAGRVLILGGAGITQGVSAEDDPEKLIDSNLLDGLPEADKAHFRELYIRWKAWGVRPSLIDFLPSPDRGIAFQYASVMGANLGAELPMAFVVRGRSDVARVKALLHQGALFSGSISYNYQGTIHPYKIEIWADISKVHDYMSQHFKANFLYAKADIYREAENLKEAGYIDVKVYDESGSQKDTYHVQQILDKVLDKIIEAAFDKRTDITPDKSKAVAEGGRWWWWSGSYAYRESAAQYEKIFNFRMTIAGTSGPIPISIGLYVDVPAIETGNCLQIHLLKQRMEFERLLRMQNCQVQIEMLTAFNERMQLQASKVETPDE